jgi:polysaccharide export outer membrane protein
MTSWPSETCTKQRIWRYSAANSYQWPSLQPADAINDVLSYLVDTDGKVNLPSHWKSGGNRTSADGMPPLKYRIYMQNSYLRDPIIELSVVNLKVTLLGEFSKQG